MRWKATASDVDTLISDSHGSPRTVTVVGDAPDTVGDVAERAWRERFGFDVPSGGLIIDIEAAR